MLLYYFIAKQYFQIYSVNKRHYFILHKQNNVDRFFHFGSLFKCTSKNSNNSGKNEVVNFFYFSK